MCELSRSQGTQTDAANGVTANHFNGVFLELWLGRKRSSAGARLASQTSAGGSDQICAVRLHPKSDACELVSTSAFAQSRAGKTTQAQTTVSLGLHSLAEMWQCGILVVR